MKKVIDDGFYCGECRQFINRQRLYDFECHCGARKWSKAKMVLEVENQK